MHTAGGPCRGGPLRCYARTAGSQEALLLQDLLGTSVVGDDALALALGRRRVRERAATMLALEVLELLTAAVIADPTVKRRVVARVDRVEIEEVALRVLAGEHPELLGRGLRAIDRPEHATERQWIGQRVGMIGLAAQRDDYRRARRWRHGGVALHGAALVKRDLGRDRELEPPLTPPPPGVRARHP